MGVCGVFKKKIMSRANLEPEYVPGVEETQEIGFGIRGN